MVENNVCNRCSPEKYTIFHFMCQHEHTQSIWVKFEMYLKEKSFNCARFLNNPTLILFGHDGKTTTDEGFDFILLLAKFFVYKCRLNKLKPTLEALLLMTYGKFIKKW